MYKKIRKGIANKKGYTLAEMIVSSAIVAMFFLVVAMAIASSSSLYLESLQRSNVTSVLQIAAEDVANNVIYGESPQLIRLPTAEEIEEGKKVPNGEGIQEGAVIYEAGDWFYIDDEEEMYFGTIDPVSGSSTPTTPPTTSPAAPKFEAEGLDLGNKLIYVSTKKKTLGTGAAAREEKRNYIRGIPYPADRYGKIMLNMKVEEEKFSTIEGDKKDEYEVYTIVLTGKEDSTRASDRVERTIRRINK